MAECPAYIYEQPRGLRKAVSRALPPGLEGMLDRTAGKQSIKPPKPAYPGWWAYFDGRQNYLRDVALDVHLIADNYATHKTALIRNWFAKRPRFHIHFTPTSASWLNLVERWFGLLPKSSCAVACTRAAASWKLPSTVTWTSPTKTPSPWSGPRPPTKSWPAWPAFANVL